MSTLLTDTLKTRVAGAAVTTTNGLNVGGACTATSFIGDGSGLTGIGATSDTSTATLYVVGVSTLVGVSTFKNDVYIAGITTVGTGLTLADNIEARFGNAGDLRIFHDGSNSYIHDGGTGDLKIQGADDVIIEDTAGANSAVFNTDGSVELYYRGASAGKKLETTTSGINVTGVATAGTISATTGTYTGTVTANSFSGNGAALTGLPAGFTELDGALFN